MATTKLTSIQIVAAAKMMPPTYGEETERAENPRRGREPSGSKDLTEVRLRVIPLRRSVNSHTAVSRRERCEKGFVAATIFSEGARISENFRHRRVTRRRASATTQPSPGGSPKIGFRSSS